MLAWAAAGMAVPAEERAGQASALAVTSSLERLVPSPRGGGGTMIELAAGGAASHADQLVYTARFTNVGRQLLDGIRITSPIPADLRYLPDSATGPASSVLFSVDQGRTFRPAEELEVVGPDGGRRPAEPVDYTHVRWVVDGALDPGASGVVRFGAVPR